MSDDEQLRFPMNETGKLRGEAADTVLTERVRTPMATQIRRYPSADATLIENTLHPGPHTRGGAETVKQQNGAGPRSTFLVPEHLISHVVPSGAIMLP
jgi:hypothetical protein